MGTVEQDKCAAGYKAAPVYATWQLTPQERRAGEKSPAACCIPLIVNYKSRPLEVIFAN
jgi:hypothetical protein